MNHQVSWGVSNVSPLPAPSEPTKTRISLEIWVTTETVTGGIHLSGRSSQAFSD